MQAGDQLPQEKNEVQYALVVTLSHKSPDTHCVLNFWTTCVAELKKMGVTAVLRLHGGTSDPEEEHPSFILIEKELWDHHIANNSPLCKSTFTKMNLDLYCHATASSVVEWVKGQLSFLKPRPRSRDSRERSETASRPQEELTSQCPTNLSAPDSKITVTASFV